MFLIDTNQFKKIDGSLSIRLVSNSIKIAGKLTFPYCLFTPHTIDACIGNGISPVVGHILLMCEALDWVLNTATTSCISCNLR